MKKNSILYTLLLLVLPFVFISCSDDEEMPAIITFDSDSTVSIDDFGVFTVSGTVTAEKGDIDEITIMCLFKERGEKSDGTYGDVNKSEKAADIKSKEVNKNGKNEYTFTINQANTTMLSHITQVHGIRVNVRMKNGTRSSEVWSIKAQFKY